jgi:hypothetical protein
LAVVGVPERTPVEERLNPVGSTPEMILQVKVPVPPTAISVVVG